MQAPMIYSYRRVSSQKQVSGAGITIQTDRELLEHLAEKYDLPISPESIDDIGVSSFRGKNLTNGELGVFVDAVKAGKISRGSILAMQNLDRLSRQGVDAGQHLYTTLRKAGLRIYSAHDMHLFGGDPGQDDADSIRATIIFKRAWSESDVKSRRATSTAQAQIQRFNNGQGRHPEGFPEAIKVAGTSVWWVDEADGYVRRHKRLFPVAQEIYKRMKQGWGTNRIVEWLNANHEPPLRRSNTKDPTRWSHSGIQKFHHNPALYGLKQFKLHINGKEDHNGNSIPPVGFSLENYYPPIMNKEEFLALKEVRRSRSTSNKTKKDKRHVSLITGMKLAFCLDCEGDELHSLGNSGHPKGYRRLYCIDGTRHGSDGCKGWSLQAPWVEGPLLKLCKDKLWRAPEVDDTVLKAGIARAKELDEQIENLIDVATESTQKAKERLVKRIDALVNELDEQEARNEQEQARLAAQSSKDTSLFQKEWEQVTERALDPNNHAAREVARDLIRQSVECILVGRDSSKLITIYILFVDGDERLICCDGAEILSFATIGTPAARTKDFIGYELSAGTDIDEAVRLVKRDAVLMRNTHSEMS